MNKDLKEWLGLALIIAGGAAVVAGISALSHGNFSETWLFGVVMLTTLCASGVGTAMLAKKWEDSINPVVWVVGYFLFIMPACLALASRMLDAVVGK